MGDFNIDLLKSESCDFAIYIYVCMISKFYSQYKYNVYNMIVHQ